MGSEEGWRRIEGVLEQDWRSIFIGFRRFVTIFMDFHRFSFMRCSKMLEIANNNVLCFLFLYLFIPAIQALSCLANDRS